MITITGKTMLKKALQFKPETGELAGKVYDLHFRVCSNPACDCGYGILDFYTEEEEEVLVAQVGANVKEQTLKLPDGSPTLSSYVKETMEAGLKAADWESLQRGYYLYKHIRAERFDVESLDLDFPEDLIEDPGAMQPYIDYLPAAEVFYVKIGEEVWALIDQYCVNPECGCTDVFLSPSGEGAPPTGFLYDYKTRKIDTKAFSFETSLAEGLFQVRKCSVLAGHRCVEELVTGDLAVGHLVHADLIHVDAAGTLHGHIHLHGHGEVIARHDGVADPSGVHLLDALAPLFGLGHHRVEALYALGAGCAFRFGADDILVIEFGDRRREIAFAAEFGQSVGHFLRRHRCCCCAHVCRVVRENGHRS